MFFLTQNIAETQHSVVISDRDMLVAAGDADMLPLSDILSVVWQTWMVVNIQIS